jgi:hypothetical protein
MAPFLINTGFRTRIAQSLAIVAAFVALWLPGCATNEKVKLAANGAPDYRSLQISYDLASTPELQRLDQPSAVEQTADVESTSDGQSAAQTSRPWTRRRVHLELQYPYPGVHPAFARATLRIVTDGPKKSKPETKPRSSEWKDVFSFSGTSVSDSKREPTGKKTDALEPSKLPPDDQEDLAATEEVLYIDIPKTELDEVLTELAKTDFFKLPSNPDGASHLVVVFNKGRCEKVWAREDHLDRLVEMLRRHGAPIPAQASQPKKT